MFNKERYTETKFVVCVLLSIALLLVDRSNDYTNVIKGQVSVIFKPIYDIANTPRDFFISVSERLVSHKDLFEENQQLKLEKLQLKGMLQKFTSLKQENQRLRLMLKSSEKVSDKLLVAELLHATNEPGTQQFVLNQGADQAVYVGQAVIDANGVIGQVLNVNQFNSRVLLITDIEHAIPVEVLRNNYRAIAVGMGNKEYLELTNVPNTTDIIIGDMLVTSGLGKRFPSGYPVGKVVFIDKNPALPFAKIIVEPVAKINQVREVLLVWPGSKVSFNKDSKDKKEIKESKNSKSNNSNISDDLVNTQTEHKIVAKADNDTKDIKNNTENKVTKNINKIVKKNKIDSINSASFSRDFDFQNTIQDDVEEVRVDINNSIGGS